MGHKAGVTGEILLRWRGMIWLTDILLLSLLSDIPSEEAESWDSLGSGWAWGLLTAIRSWKDVPVHVLGAFAGGVFSTTRGPPRANISSNSLIREDRAWFVCSISADFLRSHARARARALWVNENCLVLTKRLVEFPFELEKFAWQDLALACKFTAKPISGSFRVEARDAFACSESSEVEVGKGVPPSDFLTEMTSSSDPSLF